MPIGLVVVIVVVLLLVCSCNYNCESDQTNRDATCSFGSPVSWQLGLRCRSRQWWTRRKSQERAEEAAVEATAKFFSKIFFAHSLICLWKLIVVVSAWKRQLQWQLQLRSQNLAHTNRLAAAQTCSLCRLEDSQRALR